MVLPDWIFRVVYYYGYRAARIVWKFTKPHRLGALVALWHDNKIILVRQSYRENWILPGGGVQTCETPAQAAIREIAEELGFEILLEEMQLALISEHFWENRHDKVYIFEVHLSSLPNVSIDNREIVEARFVSINQVKTLNLLPHVQDYFRTKAIVQ